MNIPFNKPFLTGKETEYIVEAVNSGKISGNGMFTQKCQNYFEEKFGFGKCLLTTSCTDALEMAAILLDIKSGDEVIMPSYTFVSTANAFVLRGAIIKFADCYPDLPNMDPDSVEGLINERTKAIVVVHYAGIACDMDEIKRIAAPRGIPVIEDAAQAIDSFYKGRALGGIGDLAAFSFHETKNIISGEGGLLAVNTEKHFERAEIIWEKGTNRAAFFRGEVDKYNWVDIGSSFLPSEIVAAFLYAQLEQLQEIQTKRIMLWEKYYHTLLPLAEFGHFMLPRIPEYATNNAHMFFLVLNSPEERVSFINDMRTSGIRAIFHYLSLHQSPFYQDRHDGRSLPHSDKFTECLIRLPLFYDLKDEEQDYIIERIINHFL